MYTLLESVIFNKNFIITVSSDFMGSVLSVHEWHEFQHERDYFLSKCSNKFFWLHGVQPFLRSEQPLSWSRNSLYIMEPGCSLPYSQQPATYPYY
jgi:hypothetical protein